MKFPYTENFKVQFHSIRDRPIPVAFKKITTTPYVGESFRIFFLNHSILFEKGFWASKMLWSRYSGGPSSKSMT